LVPDLESHLPPGAALKAKEDQAVAAPEAVLANLAAELVVAVRNVGVAEGVEPVEVGVVVKKNPQAHPQHKRILIKKWILT